MKLHQKESKNRLNEFVLDIITTSDAQDLLTADGLYNVIDAVKEGLIPVANSLDAALNSIKMFKKSLNNAQKDIWEIRTEKIKTLRELYTKNQAAENLAKMLLNKEEKTQYEEKIKFMHEELKTFDNSQQSQYKEITTDILRDEMKEAMDDLKEILNK